MPDDYDCPQCGSPLAYDDDSCPPYYCPNCRRKRREKRIKADEQAEGVTEAALAQLGRYALESLSGGCWTDGTVDGIAAEAMKLKLADTCDRGFFRGKTQNSIDAHADLIAEEMEDQ